MSASSRLKAAWLFLIGVVIVIAGFFVYFTVLLPQEYSFMTMVIGLLFTVIGSVYGKRKMRTDQYSMMRDSVTQAAQAVLQQPVQAQQKQQPQPVPQPKPIQVKAVEKPKPLPVIEKPKPAPPVEKPRQLPEQQVVIQKASRPEPSVEDIINPKSRSEESRVIKLYVCTSCGAENDTRHMFCYNCGKKIKSKATKK